MRRFIASLSAAAMMLPSIATAASTPSELFDALRTQNKPVSFSVTMHSANDGAYTSAWINGQAQGTDTSNMQASISGTVDYVFGPIKIRVKGKMIVAGDMAYVQITSFSGTLDNDLFGLSGTLVQKKWISMPIEEVTGDTETSTLATMILVGQDAGAADMNFSMTKKTVGTNNVYTVELRPDFAAQLALQIREMIGDTTPVSSDFFPWRELAEGMHFTMTVNTTATDAFLSSSISINTAGQNSSFSLNGTQKVMGTSLTIHAPANSVSINEAMGFFHDPFTNAEMNEMMEEEMIMPEETDTSDDPYNQMIEEVIEETTDAPNIDCESLTALELLSEQRAGICPIVKATTRQGGW